MNPASRRPVAARGWSVTRAAAAALVRAGASADAISVFGMATGIAAGGCLAATASWPAAAAPCWLAAAALIGLRGACNVLDGMVAIAGRGATRRGELFNEVPDRVSDVAMLAGLGWAANDLALGLAAALAAVATAYVRAVAVAAGAPANFGGPMAKPRRMAVVAATALWCGLTPAGWHGWVPAGALGIVLALSLVTAALRLARAARALPS